MTVLIFLFLVQNPLDFPPDELPPEKHDPVDWGVVFGFISVGGLAWLAWRNHLLEKRFEALLISSEKAQQSAPTVAPRVEAVQASKPEDSAVSQWRKQTGEKLNNISSNLYKVHEAIRSQSDSSLYISTLQKEISSLHKNSDELLRRTELARRHQVEVVRLLEGMSVHASVAQLVDQLIKEVKTVQSKQDGVRTKVLQLSQRVEDFGKPKPTLGNSTEALRRLLDPEPADALDDEMKYKPIDEINFPPRAAKALHKAKIKTVGQLVNFGSHRLAELDNLGKKSIADIKGILFQHQVVFRDDLLKKPKEEEEDH